jgi:hypothetical protein
MDVPLKKYHVLENAPPTTVVSVDEYNYAGSFATERIVDAAMMFLLGRVVSEDIKAYRGLISEFLKVVSTPAVWFTIRLAKRTDAFEIPRWHRDGKMFRVGATEGVPSKCYKIAVTLLGAPTLVLENTPLVAEIARGRMFEERRETLAHAFERSPQVEIATGQIFAFTCGEPDSPIHSEPDIKSDRIFMSVVPGTPDQIKELANIRSLTYAE